MNANELLTLQEAATEIQRHPNTLRNWIFKGLLPAQKVGKYGRYRIKRGDLLATVKYTPTAEAE